jgi:hypothetical protein
MGTPMCTPRLVPSTLVLGSGGILLATIQDFPGMGLDIDQAILIIIPIPAITPADPLLVPAGQAPAPHHPRMRRHECSKEGVRQSERAHRRLFIDTFLGPVLASALHAG